MNLILGSYRLIYQFWAPELKNEFKNYLARCDQGFLLLGEENYGRDGHVSLLLETQEGKFEGRFAIGVEDVSRDFALLLDQKHLNIVIGDSSNVAIIHLPSRSIVLKHDTVTSFSRFHDLTSVGIDDFFLVDTSIGFIAMTYEGVVLWTHNQINGYTAIEITHETITVDLEMQPGVPQVTVVLDIRTGVER